MNDNHLFSRQPRFLPDMPSGEIMVPDPPYKHEKPEIGWFTLLAPPAVMLVITFLVALTAQSIFLMISIATTAVTLISSLAGATAQIRRHKNKKKERETKYLQFIADRRSELAIAAEKQIKAMNEMNPEPAVCLERMRRLDKKLWERTASYPDFLSLRVGLGSMPAAVRIKYNPQGVVLESDPLLMEPQRLALEFESVKDVPVTVDLQTAEICGIAGEEAGVLELVRLMLLQVITHHGYDDVRVVLLAADEYVEKWIWLKHLPHLWDDGFETRYLLCGKAMAHQALGELYGELKARESRAVTAGGSTLPHYVFIVEDASLLDNEPVNRYLYNRSGKLGVSAVFIAKHQAYLPMNCRTVITLTGRSGELADRGSGSRSPFVPDRLDSTGLEQAVRILAPLRIRQTGASFTIPASVTLLELLRATTVEEVDLIGRWSRNRTFKGISVPIGVKAGGALFNLDLHETGHGPHGLVAGTTGSGKSELLQSIIVSLAVNYHPHDVVFVLIDYKGGGMADAFRGMPHLVGTITNLGGNQTTRALLSIKSELQRRQRIFSAYGVGNIDKYQKLYHSKEEKNGMPPVPHLVMIADEFAELKQDQPDFMKELVSAARVGRSLGVHLILATQKPAGVVDDQIWSNSKFKICLKVQDETDSKDVIKRPDAAMIKEPGRAYIQVGNDEMFELFQSAYSGADYDPDGELLRSENRVKRLYEIRLDGRTEQIYPLEEEKIAKKELQSQLKAMVDGIASVSGSAGIVPLEGPWLPPLPERMDMTPLFGNDTGFDAEKAAWRPVKEIFSVPVGLLDDPRNQRQEPLLFDFASEGNLFVYGAPGTGKTVLLKTLCLSLAYRYSPSEANLYIMDFGGASFKAFERLPHCGGIMTLEQESRISQFVLFLFRVIEERKKLWEETDCGGFADYRSRAGALPAILVVIDNYFALSETYENIDERMVVLAREGFKYGIYMAVTATNASLVRYKFAVNFKMAASLQLTDKAEYDGIVGRTEGLEPARVVGRGLVRGTPPLEFQTAEPELGPLSTVQWIDRFDQLADAGRIGRALPIPVMPASIDMAAINGDVGTHVAIGLCDHDLQPVNVDLAVNPVIMIAGDPMAGKSTLLVSWIGMLCDKLGEERVQVYAMDSSAMGLYPLFSRPNVTDLSQVGDMCAFIDGIKAELDDRRSRLLNIRRSGGDIDGLMRSLRQIVFVFDRLSEFTNSEHYSFKELIERIVKQERGLKAAVMAADNTAELAGNWDSLGKAIREEQTGVLLGSLKDQNLFNARLPYGVQEKELAWGDGYFIIKNRYTGLRAAAMAQAPPVPV
ncbi:type VII secretion protein EssC [Paenibacillus sp. KQZ6P-2]|uniref:Type VII secretion protein EssC n=1 Tax=Paenibacillus mangrovi TaxID=2931978 RepID=A0A9X2B2D5_9BACL|nr:type VII secretion protein EssC [Paenibacillus mangrovi]MCJ8011820.1 type VII secretion protein EssC [Paenibacillus mangrovi]